MTNGSSEQPAAVCSLDQADDGSQFVLLKCGNLFSVFVTRPRFQLMVNYYYALDHAKTWGDFLTICGKHAADFFAPFLESDEITPSSDDLIVNLSDELWVLSESEFPETQCLEETTTLHGHKFPRDYQIGSISTEYGHDIDLYTVVEVRSLVEEVRKSGIDVAELNMPFPLDIRHYG